MLPYYMGGKPQNGSEFFENLSSKAASLTSSAFANLSSLSHRNIGGMEPRGANIDSADANGSFFARQIPAIPSFTPRISNPLHSFTTGMPLYLRRDVSSPSDSSNNGVSTLVQVIV